MTPIRLWRRQSVSASNWLDFCSGFLCPFSPFLILRLSKGHPDTMPRLGADGAERACSCAIIQAIHPGTERSRQGVTDESFATTDIVPEASRAEAWPPELFPPLYSAMAFAKTEFQIIAILARPPKAKHADDVHARQFIAFLGSSAATWPIGREPQRAVMPVIGFLSSFSINTRFKTAFNDGLRRLDSLKDRT